MLEVLVAAEVRARRCCSKVMRFQPERPLLIWSKRVNMRATLKVAGLVDDGTSARARQATAASADSRVSGSGGVASAARDSEASSPLRTPTESAEAISHRTGGPRPASRAPRSG